MEGGTRLLSKLTTFWDVDRQINDKIFMHQEMPLKYENNTKL